MSNQRYIVYVDEFSGKESITLVMEDGNQLGIPTDPANSDYQAYLKSLEA